MKSFLNKKAQKIFMKKTCVDCKTRFEFTIDDLEEGDPFDCPECGLEYTLIYKGDKPTLVESKTLEMDNDEFELDSSEDYS
jgi:DNA-directed RNA polymerase subunit RPC12/RpoP